MQHQTLITLQEEKAFSEDQSALVSTAYATLRQPLKRAIYLVRAVDSAVWRVAGGLPTDQTAFAKSICGTVAFAFHVQLRSQALPKHNQSIECRVLTCSQFRARFWYGKVVLAPRLKGSTHKPCLLQLERAGRLEAGSGGEGMTAEDPLLLARVMEVREQIEDARVRPRVENFGAGLPVASPRLRQRGAAHALQQQFAVLRAGVGAPGCSECKVLS